jgi:hypothetical protein
MALSDSGVAQADISRESYENSGDFGWEANNKYEVSRALPWQRPQVLLLRRPRWRLVKRHCPVRARKSGVDWLLPPPQNLHEQAK